MKIDCPNNCYLNLSDGKVTVIDVRLIYLKTEYDLRTKLIVCQNIIEVISENNNGKLKYLIYKTHIVLLYL